MGNWTTRERDSSGSEETGKSYSSSSKYKLESERDDVVQEMLLVHVNPVNSVCAADSTHIITGTNDNSLLVYQWTCHVVKQTFQLESKPATRIVCNKVNNLAYAACRDGCVYGWKWAATSTGVDLLTLKDHTLSVTGLATNDDILVSGSRDNTVKIWDVGTHSCIKSVHIPRNLVTDIKWMAGDKCVLQSSEDKSLRIWDTRTCSVVHKFPSKQHIQLCCAVSECGNYLASGSSGQPGSGSELTLWDRRKVNDNSSDDVSGVVREYKGHSSSVNSCMFLSGNDTKMIVSCSNDSSVKVWNRDSQGCLISEYISGAGPVSEVVSPTASMIACGTFYKGVKVWGLHKSSSNSEYMLNLRAKY